LAASSFLSCSDAAYSLLNCCLTAAQNGEGWAFTALGERLTLGVNEREQVVVLDREPAPDGRDLIHQWLRVAASAVLEARRAKAAKGKVIFHASEEDARLPASVTDLIAYEGFTG
jgi:hypothetical protein